jgi:hypothetical protein
MNIRPLALMVVGLLLSGCASTNLTGSWRYTEGLTQIGLDFKSAKDCRLSLSGFVRENLEKKCLYLAKQKNIENSAEGVDPVKRYLIFLINNAGVSNIFPDFEFSFDKKSESLTLFIGQVPFVMQKSDR